MVVRNVVVALGADLPGAAENLRCQGWGYEFRKYVLARSLSFEVRQSRQPSILISQIAFVGFPRTPTVLQKRSTSASAFSFVCLCNPFETDQTLLLLIGIDEEEK